MVWDGKRKFQEALLASGLDYTIIVNGCFYETLFTPFFSFDPFKKKAGWPQPPQCAVLHVQVVGYHCACRLLLSPATPDWVVVVVWLRFWPTLLLLIFESCKDGQALTCRSSRLSQVHIKGNGEDEFWATSAQDVARWLPEVLLCPSSRNAQVNLVGEILSWDKAVRIFEQATGKPPSPHAYCVVA